MPRANDDPDAEIPVDPVTKQPKYYVVSASQLKTWWACRRKWGWEKIMKLRGPEGRGAALGTLVHAQLEDYLKEDKSLDFSIRDPFGTLPAEVAQTGLQYIPAPKSEGLHVEKYFKFPVPVPEGHPPIYVRGYKDYFVEATAREDGLPHVGDHKSCGNWAYALTADDLQNDVQAIIYAWDALLANPEASAVTLQWTYYGTKKPYRAQPVRATVTREHVTELIQEVFSGSLELVTTLMSRPEVLALPYNADECGKYGKDGCPFQGNCNLSPKERRPRNMSTATVSTSNLAERIKARNAAATAPAPAAAPATGGIAARIAAAKARAAAGEAPAPSPAQQTLPIAPAESEADARARVANMLETGQTIAGGPDAVLARTMIDEVIETLPTPAWALEKTPYAGATAKSTMPASDQPINCPSDFQPPPASASTPVEVAPELAAAITAAAPAKGRPKGTKAAPAPSPFDGIDPALIQEFLTLGIQFFKNQAAQ